MSLAYNLDGDNYTYSYQVNSQYAYSIEFFVDCAEHVGNIAKLIVLQNNQTVASKNHISEGLNSIVFYPSMDGEVIIQLSISEFARGFVIKELTLKKLEKKLLLAKELGSVKYAAAVASIPQRESALHDTVLSILPQVDVLFVYLNGYTQIPEFLVHDKIECVLDESGRPAAAAKMYWINYVFAYYFTLDDDIIYPTDYVKRTVGLYEELNQKSVVSYHGKKFKTLATHSRLDRKKMYLFEEQQENKEKVDVLGTGLMMIDTRQINYDLFSVALRHPRSIDLSVSIFLKNKGVPRFVLPKEKSWLKQNPKVGHGLNEFKQIEKKASADVDNLMYAGRPWVDNPALFRFIKLLLTIFRPLRVLLSNRKLKKLLRDPKKFILDSNHYLICPLKKILMD